MFDVRYYFPVNQWVVARKDYHRLLKQVPGLAHPMFHSFRHSGDDFLDSHPQCNALSSPTRVSRAGSSALPSLLSLICAQVYINGTSPRGTFENYVSPALPVY